MIIATRATTTAKVEREKKEVSIRAGPARRTYRDRFPCASPSSVNRRVLITSSPEKSALKESHPCIGTCSRAAASSSLLSLSLSSFFSSITSFNQHKACDRLSSRARLAPSFHKTGALQCPDGDDDDDEAAGRREEGCTRTQN